MGAGTPTEPDVLEGGVPERARRGDRGGPRTRRLRRRRLVLFVLAVAVGALGWQLDARERSREAEALLGAVAAAEASADWASGRVRGTLQYASPAVQLSSTPPGARRDLAVLIEDAAAEAAGVLREDARGVRALPARAWHDEVGRARDAYAAHLELRAERWDALARDALAAQPPDDPVRRQGDAARQALVALVGRAATAAALDEPR